MPIWILAAVLFGLVVIADESYEEAIQEAQHTRFMVCSGHWPPEVSDAPVDCSDHIPDAGYLYAR